jgi:hypothetical protein
VTGSLEILEVSLSSSILIDLIFIEKLLETADLDLGPIGEMLREDRRTGEALGLPRSRAIHASDDVIFTALT